MLELQLELQKTKQRADDADKEARQWNETAEEADADMDKCFGDLARVKAEFGRAKDYKHKVQ